MTYQEAKTRPGTTLVEFYASWCPHCQRMEPVVDELRAMVGTTAAICQFDVDAHPHEAEEAGADTIPTFIVFKDGREAWRHVGEISADMLLSAIRSAR